MQRRKRIRRISFLLALITALTAWGAAGSVASLRLRREKNAVQEHALNAVCEYLDEIETTLQKAACVSTGKKLISLSSDLRAQAQGAKTGLSDLSAGEGFLSNTYKFLSQVGAYTASLGKRLDAGQTLSEEDVSALTELGQKAGALRARYEYMSGLLGAGLFSFEEIREGLKLIDDGSADLSFYPALSREAEESMADFPTLIYDGPFSDRIFLKESYLLSVSQEISREKAAEVAAKALGTEKGTLVFEGETQGKLPLFCFSDGGRRIGVTKNGGFAAWILSDAFEGSAKLTRAEAREKGEAFLSSLGYDGMRPTYEAETDGVCLVNFAGTVGEYKAYPDLIKVGVSLSDGRVVSLDARDYLMNRAPRAVPAPAVSEEAARSLVNGRLEVRSTDLALIPTPGGGEVFAYEFLCRDSSGRDALVYVNVATGDEEDVLLLLYGDGGTLTK